MFIIKEYSMAIKLDEVNKILYSYDIKNDIVDENSKEILTQTNNLIYGKIKSYFKSICGFDSEIYAYFNDFITA